MTRNGNYLVHKIEEKTACVIDHSYVQRVA